ncbi:TRAP transporter small permease subunit [uncultured Litoreibacter sp.]|uniref:TRAP transporter small permease n=1 Tax=uncultured Litoreibacter sp. TaxID=1392394 RepID=UPI0026081C7B|nr:TRAP transporter small permease subunit [uncultured Litoreibacter sp.]
MIKKLDGLLSAIEVWSMVALTLLGLAFAFLQVVLRYVFNTGIHWLEAGLVTALIWAMLIGSVRAVREGYHPRVELLPNLVGEKARAVLNFLAIGGAFLLACFFLWDSIFYARFIDMINALHPELGIKQVYPFLIVPIITFMMLIRYGLLAWALLSEPASHSPDATFRKQVGDTSDKGIVD